MESKNHNLDYWLQHINKRPGLHIYLKKKNWGNSCSWNQCHQNELPGYSLALKLSLSSKSTTGSLSNIVSSTNPSSFPTKSSITLPPHISLTSPAMSDLLTLTSWPPSPEPCTEPRGTGPPLPLPFGIPLKPSCSSWLSHNL